MAYQRTPSTRTELLYFDHNATTFVAPEVANAMAAALSTVHGNPSSIHRDGQLARQHLERSRSAVAKRLGASPPEIIFTSGGTESNNLAILGLVRSLPAERKHVVTTTIEHPSVLEACRELEREGVDVTYAGVDSDGVVDPQEIRRSLRAETVLVSMMHANNETGTIQPVEAIANMVRERRAGGQTIFFHSDGVQAFGKIGTEVELLGVDLYSVSAHKLYAPKGIGGLFVRKGVPLRGIQYGGRQERERRAGTENVPGAIAFAKAVELCAHHEANTLARMRDRFEDAILKNVEHVEVNGSTSMRLPNTSNLLFHGVSGESLVIALDMQGIAVSSGSACSSGSLEPSHVLLAAGRTRAEARSSVRFSLGRYNTPEDVDTVSRAVISCVARLRKAARSEERVVV